MESITNHDTLSNPSYDSDKATMTESYHEPQLMEVNESGHIQELERNFSLFSICSVGIVTGNTWAALGGSIAVAIYNGGPPGVLYEFIAVSIFYWLIAASLAELASCMPSSAGVYHWASVTPGPRYGPLCGWFAGWWNTFAWICATATMSSISSQILLAMYGVYRPDYEQKSWHVFVGYLIITWLCCSTVLFANRALPMINKIGLLFIIAGVVVTTIICAVTPYTAGSGHATSSFVWAEWRNDTGYSSNGFVFLAGMLNGAYAIGTPDCVSHLAEEIPRPRRNIPLAIGAQMIFGFASTFVYAITILYAITDLDEITNSQIFPLSRIYAQATSSNSGTIGLLCLIFVPIFCCCIGSYITASRCLWTIARDGAVPFSGTLKVISQRFKNPFNAALVCGCFASVLGVIAVGSTTAFNAFVGSFVVLSTMSYLVPILGFIFTRRFSRSSDEPGPYTNCLKPGPYQMGDKLGYTVNIISCCYILTFVVIYCFPYSLPAQASNMNYSILITGALTLSAGMFWIVKGGTYIGPKAMIEESPISDMGTLVSGASEPKDQTH